jgi:hypothetical protein
VKSELLLVISNWRFVKQNQELPATPCKPHDCTVSLKLSSTGFLSANPDAGGSTAESFRFDKQGACFSYDAFLDLLANNSMVSEFLAEVRRLYEADAGALQLLSESDVFGDEDANDESGVTDEPEVTIRQLFHSIPLIEAATASAVAFLAESPETAEPSGITSTIPTGSKRRAAGGQSSSSSSASTTLMTAPGPLSTKRSHYSKK